MPETASQNRIAYPQEHILACLSSAPSNARIIRTAARMAEAFHCPFTALFVETPDFAAATAQNKERLESNQDLARQLGARIEIVYGEDVPYQIAEYARVSGITRIVLGRSTISRRHLFGKPTLTELLLHYAPEIDIHIIPDSTADNSYHPRRVGRPDRFAHIGENSLKSALVLLGATLLSMLFHKMGFTSPNIIMTYILGVLVTSIITSHRVYSLISSIASVIIFNFLFTEPRFSLTAYETGYPVTFIVMFLTAYITGTFSIQYKEQARQSAQIARRTNILFDTDQMLSKVHDREAILHTTAEQLLKLLGRSILVYECRNSQLCDPLFFPVSDDSSFDPAKELAVAEWVLASNHGAGATTRIHSEADYYHLAVRVNERIYAIIGVESSASKLDISEHGMLLSILSQTALALENAQNVKEKEEAAVLAEREQLRANLLRTISHDLRTPLTTISGNASNLLSNAMYFDEETRQQIYSDIYNDAIWLTDLVENLLYATRIEEGRMMLRTSPELLSEIVEEAVHHIGRKAATHPIEVHYENDLQLVRADARLIIQVIANIIDNALKYTPEGSVVTLTTVKKGEMAEIRIADTGNGIPDEEKAMVFEKFYCGKNKIADNRRSIGLGLYLCKTIIEAHGGMIRVEDNDPQGAVFCFTLPLEEVTYCE